MVPRFRDLKSIRGTAEEVLAELKALDAHQGGESRLVSWHPGWKSGWKLPTHCPLLREELQAVITAVEPTEGSPRPEVLRTSLIRPDTASTTPQLITRNLSELDPEDVFYQLCHNGEAAEEREDYDDLLASFHELRNWMNETAANAE